MGSSDIWQTKKVLAEISLLPAGLSGRSSGITSGYRPNHNFGGPDNHLMRMGSIAVQGNAWINPGECKEAEVLFIFPAGCEIALHEGLEWRIQEGDRHVGNGKVKRVLDDGAGS